MEFSVDWLTDILKAYSQGTEIQSIVSFDVESATKQGDNYLSAPARIKMKVALGSGRIVHKSIVLKRAPTSEKEVDFINHLGIYTTEIKIYTVVLAEFERFMNENWDPNGPLWARYYGSKDNNDIIFEDLKESGFHVADRISGLDLKHSKVVLWSLGRFHALSFMLYRLKRLDPDMLSSYWCCRNEERVNASMSKFVESTLDILRTEWSAEWAETTEKVEKLLKDNLNAKLNELGKIDDSHFNVLNHGDPWTTNMMFNYCPITGDPIHLRFLDFQISHYNSYVFDLVYFIYTSVKASVRKENFYDLLETYHRSVVATFGSYNFTPKIRLPTVKDIENDMRSKSLLTLVVTFCFVHIMLCRPENVIPLEEMISLDANPDGPRSNFKKNTEVNEFLQNTVPDILSLMESL